MARRVTHDPIGARIAEKRKQRKWSIRSAAKVAGIAASSWSRIERGLQACDNRFMLADIAAALGCPVAELSGATETASRDPKLVVARSCVPAIREALVEADLDEAPTVEAPPLAVLERETALVDDLRSRCDFAGAAPRLPNLIEHLHAATHGPDWEAALRLMALTGHVAHDICKYVGYPGEAWIAAGWSRHAAQRLDDPVTTGGAEFVRAVAAWECGAYKRAHTYAVRAADGMTAHTDADGAAEHLGMLLLTSAHTAYATKRPGDGAEFYAEAVRLAARTGETRTPGLFFGPTNVAFWQVGTLADGGDPDGAARVALATNPGVLTVPSRQAFFHLHTAQAFTRVGRDKDAERHILVAERVAPQLVRASPIAAETARGLRYRVGGSALRGLCERLGVLD